MAAGNIPAAMISLTAAPASFVEGKAASSVRMHSGRFNNPQNDFGGDAESTFGAHENSGKVIAEYRAFFRRDGQRAIGKNDFQARHALS